MKTVSKCYENVDTLTKNLKNFENVVPKCKVKGFEHINYGNKTVPAKNIATVSYRRPLKCSRKISENMSKDIFETFYKLNIKDEQDIYLQGLIEVRSVQQRLKRNTEGRNPSNSYRYCVSIGQQKYIVCLNVFCSVHATTVDRIRQIKKLQGSNDTPLGK
ncbi:hypothetical protein QE152_g9888 [Popillia japonica]|uniref:Uncharacterized protein n=1 Tax=Popillia japonica TaxID=7064 RepID=A0AAW1LX71_POPJA